MSDDQIIEPLEKKCPRCGGKSANPSNPSGRCSACLKKLAANKKKPGHWQRAQTKADDALRRQKGKNGTAHKKHSGLGSRASIVKQTQAAEKKTGQKLSPDRKNNAKGYAASNTRMVPEKLNRGRHHVDEKKLRNWKKRLKKSEIDTASLYTLLKAKAYESQDENLINLIKSLTPETLEQHIEMFDIEGSLEKSAAPKLEPEAPKTPSLANEVGKTHTVEVHPHMDLLYRAKGLIKENKRDYLHIGDFKQAGFPGNIIKILPRDANGKVTPEMIDKHIESLPKKKVNITVMPYTLNAQMHRPLKDGNKQFGLKIRMLPEQNEELNLKTNNMWNSVSRSQHRLGQEKDLSDTIGWARIDPYAKPNLNHWHIDEVQSDFQHHEKDAFRDVDPEHVKNIIEHISHGFNDPQHLIHSAVNNLARKLNINSTSMDMPQDQAIQSGLAGKDALQHQYIHFDPHMYREGWDELVKEWISNNKEIFNHHTTHEGIWNGTGKAFSDKEVSENPHFKSVADKLGESGLKHMVTALTHSDTSDPYHSLYAGAEHRGEFDDMVNGEENEFIKSNPEIAKKVASLSDEERDALSSFLNKYSGVIDDHVAKHFMELPERPDADAPRGALVQRVNAEAYQRPIPIHILDTYKRRPKSLGMKEIPKETIFGNNPEDPWTQVQYMNLHKKIMEILEQIKKASKV